MDTLQAALRGALRAVGVIFKQEEVNDPVERQIAGGAGGEDGGEGDGGGVCGGEEFLDALPGAARADSSSDESSYGVVSDSDTESGGDSVVLPWVGVLCLVTVSQLSSVLLSGPF